MGFRAGTSITSCYGLTAVGYRAAQSSTSRMTTAFGNGAACSLTTGCHNVAVGGVALRSTTTGQQNVAVGYYALGRNTTGAGHTIVGNYAQASINTGINNTIAIGCCAATSANSNHTVWGNSSMLCHCIWGTWTNVSDCRDKANIKTLSSKFGLSLINKLRPVSFNWDFRDKYVKECKYEYGHKDGSLVTEKESYGIIAQELKQALDELDIRFDGLGYTEEHDAYRIGYDELIAPIIKAIQEQQEQIESLKQEVELLKSK